ncbi:MAG: hypothetical protein JJU41_03830 [Bacteroidetes bacterium]|nr:hypothetical protein [Bacteroidota bacterium]MCH8524464.1 hypothetical protein [Balneolales bacterium]
MQIKRLTSLILLVLLVVSGVQSQDRYQSGSSYSALGAGFPVDFRSSQGAGMGISGVSISNRLAGNLSNPAVWHNTYFTLANGGLSFNVYNAKDDFGSSVNNQFGIDHFQLQIPILRDRLGASVALFPETQSRFSSISTTTVQPATVGADSLQFTSFFRGEGGLNRFEAGFGYSLTENFAVGYAASVVFGIQRQATDITFSTAGYQPVAFETRVSALGYGHRFGFYGQFLNLVSNSDGVAFGVTASLPVNLGGKREVNTITGNTINVIEREDEGPSGQLELPLEINTGLTIYFNRFAMFSAEALMQNWSNYQNFAGQNEDFLTDRLKLGAGFEYSAFRRSENNLFTRFGYRAGISFDNGHIELNDTRIQTVLFSAGLAIPSPVTGSSVDINFDYGFRGTTSHELVRERIFAVRMTFNLSELMFLQRRLQ